jgi:peroxiredoxin
MNARPPAWLLALVLTSAGAGMAGCAGAAAEGGAGQGPAVELELKDVSGRPFSLQELRGKPLLLFVFATYDSASQLALLTLERWSERHHDVTVLGVAAQPQAERLLPLHRDTLNIRIPLAYDPGEHLINGHSALGRVDVIPSYVLLDGQGRVLARQAGALDESGVDALAARAR